MYKSLDMNLVSIKKHESILDKNEPTFLFLGEVIPITNQHTDSHPCIRLGWSRSLIGTKSNKRPAYTKQSTKQTTKGNFGKPYTERTATENQACIRKGKGDSDNGSDVRILIV